MLKAARARASKKGLAFDLTREFLLELNEQQAGRCAISGMLLDWERRERRSHGQRECPPWRASLDRRDSTQGYTRDNVQLVTDTVNRAKGSLDLEVLLTMCRAVLQQNELCR